MAYKNIYYKLMTLDAAEILAAGNNGQFELDLNNALNRERYVLKVEDHADCALFRQIMLAAGQESGKLDQNEEPDEHDPKALFGMLVYLDFKRVFEEKIELGNPLFNVLVGMDEEQKQDEIDARGSALMKNGLRLKLKGDAESTIFYPFDKSGNMSREGRSTFLSSKLYDEVDERVRLGIDFKKIEVEPSKYFSYRGLYMSDGKRITDPTVTLNKDTVIVIPDAEFKIHTDVVTCEVRMDGDKILLNEDKRLPLTGDDGTPLVIKDKEISVNSFDGEGIISKEYAIKINDELFGKGKFEAASFQCRMPFVKGMLHMVDFKEFLKEQLGLDSLDGVNIKDICNKKRDLGKAKIILTESMFKGADWLKTAAGKKDPMELYFSRFKDDGHALYITNTSRSFEDVDKVKLNYQFINTIGFRKSEMTELVVNHYEEARDMRVDPDTARRVLLRRQDLFDSDETMAYDDEHGAMEDMELPSWKYAMRCNKYFMHDDYIQDKLKELAKEMRKNALLGKINVAGALCFLSGDLLSFMIHVIGQIGEAKQTVRINTADVINDLSEQRIKGDEFYLPGYHNYRFHDAGSDGRGKRYFTKGRYYGVLRSPHLSRNEQCLMTPFCPDSKSLYERYFGGLKGVLMVPRDSVVPAALAGADFDGDFVKLFAETTVNNAIKRAFKKTSSGYERLLPVAEIPEIPTSDSSMKKAPERIDFEQLRSTFSNKVGHLSNITLMIEKHEYWDKATEEKYKNWSALCTIAAGLEIDSVKTGVRPDIRTIDEMRGDEKDRFLKIKYETEKTNEIPGYLEEEPSGKRPIDWLESYFAIAAAEKPKKRKPKDIVAGKAMMFNDERIKECVRNTNENAVVEIRRTKEAYKKANNKVHEIGEQEKKTENNEYIKDIKAYVFAEYDSAVDKLAESGAPIDDAINGMVQAFEQKFTDKDEIDGAIAELYENWEDWIFAGNYDQKRSVLSTLIDANRLPDYAVELLCDTHKNEYQILKFVLQQTRGTIIGNLENRRKIESLKEGISASKDYDVGLLERLCEAYDDKETNSYWQRAADKICREKIKELFEDDMERAAAFFLSYSEEIDKKHNYFWRWFKAEEIKDLLADEPRNKQEKKNA